MFGCKLLQTWLRVSIFNAIKAKQEMATTHIYSTLQVCLFRIMVDSRSNGAWMISLYVCASRSGAETYRHAATFAGRIGSRWHWHVVTFRTGKHWMNQVPFHRKMLDNAANDCRLGSDTNQDLRIIKWWGGNHLLIVSKLLFASRNRRTPNGAAGKAIVGIGPVTILQRPIFIHQLLLCSPVSSQSFSPCNGLSTKD